MSGRKQHTLPPAPHWQPDRRHIRRAHFYRAGLEVWAGPAHRKAIDRGAPDRALTHCPWRIFDKSNTVRFGPKWRVEIAPRHHLVLGRPHFETCIVKEERTSGSTGRSAAHHAACLYDGGINGSCGHTRCWVEAQKAIRAEHPISQALATVILRKSLRPKKKGAGKQNELFSLGFWSQ